MGPLDLDCLQLGVQDALVKLECHWTVDLGDTVRRA